MAPILAASLALPGYAQESREHRVRDVTVEVTAIAGGLEHPWSVEVLPDGAYIVTERPGRMRIIRDGEVGRPLGGLPRIAAVGQGGLLDVALSPDFA
ncbi:MAG: PQQ-dependent sugar dehydrogenase, partial [Allorhizobium sp.]